MELLPHPHLFDELQIAMIPISQDSLVLQSLLKWTKTTLDGEGVPTSLSWIIYNKTEIEKLSALRKGLQELSLPLRELMNDIPRFFPFKGVRENLIAFHKSYQEIPSIDSEIHLLYLGADLFQNRELLIKLLSFIDKLVKLQESFSALKKSLVDEMLHHLSFTSENRLEPKEATPFKRDLSLDEK